MADYPEPDTPLADIQAMVIAGTWHIRREAQHDALAFGKEMSVRLCLLALTPADFHKSMDADEPKWSGARQDVYKTLFGGFDLYVKFQMWKGQPLVVSFKEQ